VDGELESAGASDRLDRRRPDGLRAGVKASCARAADVTVWNRTRSKAEPLAELGPNSFAADRGSSGHQQPLRIPAHPWRPAECTLIETESHSTRAQSGPSGRFEASPVKCPTTFRQGGTKGSRQGGAPIIVCKQKEIVMVMKTVRL